MQGSLSDRDPAALYPSASAGFDGPCEEPQALYDTRAIWPNLQRQAFQELAQTLVGQLLFVRTWPGVTVTEGWWDVRTAVLVAVRLYLGILNGRLST